MTYLSEKLKLILALSYRANAHSSVPLDSAGPGSSYSLFWIQFFVCMHFNLTALNLMDFVHITRKVFRGI